MAKSDFYIASRLSTVVTTPVSSICSTLFFVFGILKLVGTIDWSWWFVTAPIWGGFLFNITIILIVMFVLKFFDRKH